MSKRIPRVIYLTALCEYVGEFQENRKRKSGNVGNSREFFWYVRRFDFNLAKFGICIFLSSFLSRRQICHSHSLSRLELFSAKVTNENSQTFVHVLHSQCISIHSTLMSLASNWAVSELMGPCNSQNAKLGSRVILHILMILQYNL